MAISDRELQGLAKMHGEEAVAHLRTPVAETDTPKEEKTEDVTPPVEEAKPSEEKKEEKAIDVQGAVTLTDDAVLAYLKEKTGRDIKSLEDLNEKQDPAVVAEKRESDKITFALQNGILTKTQYEKYISDKADVTKVVYESFAADAREIEPDVTDEEIKAAFNEEMGLDADTDSARYKRGQKRIAALAEKELREKHSSFFSIEDKFTSYEKSSKESSERAQLIKNQTPEYKKNVEDAFATTSKVEVSIGDQKYQIEVSEEDVADLRKSFLDDAVVEDNILKGFGKVEVEGAVRMAIRDKNFSKIVESLSNKRVEEMAKGSRGIPQSTEFRKAQDSKPILSEREIKYYKAAGLLPEDAVKN